jgi:Protein NO VEIN, C-terminal
MNQNSTQSKGMPNDWSREEVEAAVADYFDMLAKELSGVPYNKAEHNRLLQKTVKRSRGSIEFKHQNITAVLIELRFANIPGYKPRFNYQELLRVVVEDRLVDEKRLQKLAQEAVEKPVAKLPVVGNILSILVSRPKSKEEVSKLRDEPRSKRKLPPRDYLEEEARNRSLGRAGEELILQFEHERLWRAGKHGLADRIEHVAKTQGDGVGYDILSFEKTGRERLIEVKTTRFGALTPFFASRNEVRVSEAHDDEYQLYRLFQFEKGPQLFVLAGGLRQTCALEPTQFVGIPK